MILSTKQVIAINQERKDLLEQIEITPMDKGKLRLIMKYEALQFIIDLHNLEGKDKPLRGVKPETKTEIKSWDKI